MRYDVIGAGAAGLAAARILSGSGERVPFPGRVPASVAAARARPHDDTIFAGEATSADETGTVAIASGDRAAKQLLAALGR